MIVISLCINSSSVNTSNMSHINLSLLQESHSTIMGLLPRYTFPRPPLWPPRPLLCPCLCPNSWYRPERRTISSKAPAELAGYKSCTKCVCCMRSFARSPKRLASPDSIILMADNFSNSLFTSFSVGFDLY